MYLCLCLCMIVVSCILSDSFIRQRRAAFVLWLLVAFKSSCTVQSNWAIFGHAEPIRMPFRGQTCVGPRNHVVRLGFGTPMRRSTLGGHIPSIPWTVDVPSFYHVMLCIRGTSHGPVSVCLSQVRVILKRLNVGSHKQHHTIAQGL